ncbi:tetratricopeptide repeat protein [Kitasatospora terrestris]|uniref:Tetratricopeptide repeat protein n=1 Tax=Kitasatospora terrestris TaxID=258051 RepID=A0ABP9DA51_9ACTN
MSAEIVRLVEQAGPYPTAAVRAYGGAVLARAGNSAADATSDLGRRVLQAVARRRSDPKQASLAAAVQDVAEDPDTLAARNNLALAHQTAGEPDRAVPLFEAALRQCLRILGDTHPTTLAVRSDLAVARDAAGGPDR